VVLNRVDRSQAYGTYYGYADEKKPAEQPQN
jgi:hypothetical protein